MLGLCDLILVETDRWLRHQSFSTKTKSLCINIVPQSASQVERLTGAHMRVYGGNDIYISTQMVVAENVSSSLLVYDGMCPFFDCEFVWVSATNVIAALFSWWKVFIERIYLWRNYHANPRRSVFHLTRTRLDYLQRWSSLTKKVFSSSEMGSFGVFWRCCNRWFLIFLVSFSSTSYWEVLVSLMGESKEKLTQNIYRR